MEKKKKNNWFLKIICVFIIMFTFVYFMNVFGYMNNVNYNRTLYTEEEINKFEKDVIDKKIKDKYINTERKDYTNKFSDAGEYISDAITEGSKYLSNLFKKIFAYLFK